MDGLARSQTRHIQANKTQLAATRLLYLYNMMHTGVLRSKVFQVWAEGCNAADLVQLHFPIYSLSACCVTSLKMSSVQQGQMQEQTILRQNYFCLSAQNSRADCAHLTWQRHSQSQYSNCSMSTWHALPKSCPADCVLGTDTIFSWYSGTDSIFP